MFSFVFAHDDEQSTFTHNQPDPNVYQKDLASLEKTFFQFRTAYQHRSLTPAELVAYNKKAHEIHLLLNSFVKNTFDILLPKDMLTCLRNWEELAYDQQEKSKYLIKRHFQLETQLQQKTTSITQKITTTCERCYQDMRKVNIGQVKGTLENQYMGTLDRMIAEAKVEINQQLFTQEEDQAFFKQLHNSLKKKHDQIDFNNKSIEALISKITKEISELNIMKKMSMANDTELEPPSYTWMRNIKSALNDLLQSTFKKKVPTFIEHMVQLFEEHLAERNKFLMRPMQTQTDEYENSQITELKEKMIKVNGAKFKLENDLLWVEHQLENSKAQITHKTAQYKQELEEKWNELLEEREANKRLKATVDIITKETEIVKEELRRKIEQDKIKQKTTRKLDNQKQIEIQRRESRQSTAVLRKSISQTLKSPFNAFQQQTSQKPRTAEKSGNLISQFTEHTRQQKFKQNFKQGQQQIRQGPEKTKIPVSKSTLRYRKSERINPDQLFQSANMKRKISETNAIPSHEFVEGEGSEGESEISSETSSKLCEGDDEHSANVRKEQFTEPRQTPIERKIFQTQHIETEKKQTKEKRPTKQFDKSPIVQSDEISSLKRQSKQKFKLTRPKSIILEEENSESVSNMSTPYNQKQSFTDAIQSIRKTIKKPSLFGSEQAASEPCEQADSILIPSESVTTEPNVPSVHEEKINKKTIFTPNVKPVNKSIFVPSAKENKPNDIELNIKIDDKSSATESNPCTTAERKYNEEVVRVNELMEKRIKRQGIMIQNRLSKQSPISVKAAQKLLKELQNNQQKIDEQEEEDIPNEVNSNILRKNHLRSQTMVQTFNKTSEELRKSTIKSPYFAGIHSKKGFTGQSTFAENKISFTAMLSNENFNKDLDNLMKFVEDTIQTSRPQKSEDNRCSKGENQDFRTLIIEFLQKYGIQQKENTQKHTQKSLKSLKNSNLFQRKTDKSVSFFREENSENKMALTQTSGFAKKSKPNQAIETDGEKLPPMYKTCFNTPKNEPSKNSNRLSTHNSIKRNVWKSLPDETEGKNAQSLERAKKSSKNQRPILKDIKKLGHKKYESCEIDQSYNPKQSQVKVDIFTKEDFELFIDQANAYSYECSHMKRHPKQSVHQEGFDRRGFIDGIFNNMEQVRELNSGFYDEIVSFIRYPYHTVKNLSWGACMVKGIKYESFVKFMERIIHLHRKCAVSAEEGCCGHLSMFSRKIESVKKQAGVVGK